jgi:succinoglycan biosynthesis protein ExoM
LDASSGDTVGGIVVAMATYKRPDEMARTLRTLLDQIDTSGVSARVQIVDNDAAGSGAAAAQAVADRRVSYVVEPTPGIAAARNRAIAESAGDRVLIFIDDDEDPQPGWLAGLLSVYREHQPAAVVGPVVSEYDGELDPWIRAGGFFERRRLPTGSLVEAAATNNLLLDLERIRSLGLSFDQKFGLSGGSDTLFTRQLTGAGEQLMWCDEAIVVDHVPTDRMTRKWVLRRAMRYGNSWSRTSLALAPDRRARLLTRIKMLARGVIRVGAGAVRFGLGAVTRSDRHRARGQRTLMKGVGYIMGATGGVYVEYSRAAPAAETAPQP